MARDWRECLAQEPRVQRLEKVDAQRAGAAQNWDSYEFKVTPTCPPSTSLNLRGGLCYLQASFGSAPGWYVGDYTVDLTDTSLVSTSTSFVSHSYTFTNAYWYAGCVVVLRYGMNPSTFGFKPSSFPEQGLSLGGTDGTLADGWEEYETAAEVENALLSMSMERANSAGMSMAALVLRNDGDVGDPNRFQPIDRVNRGRSYILWDIRQAWQIE